MNRKIVKKIKKKEKYKYKLGILQKIQLVEMSSTISENFKKLLKIKIRSVKRHRTKI